MKHRKIRRMKYISAVTAFALVLAISLSLFGGLGLASDESELIIEQPVIEQQGSEMEIVGPQTEVAEDSVETEEQPPDVSMQADADVGNWSDFVDALNDTTKATIKLMAPLTADNIKAPNPIIHTVEIDLNGQTIARDTATGVLIPVGSTGKVTIKNGIIDGGRVNAQGSLISLNGGELTLDGVTLKDNYNTSTPGNGGAIYSSGGTITVKNTVTIEGNKAAGNGGGVYGTNTTVTINGNLTINTNEATGDGGGVYGTSSTVTLNGGNISLDRNAARDGGGLWAGGGSTLLLESGGTFFTGNTASGDGGGIFVDDCGISYGGFAVGTVTANFSTNTASRGKDVYIKNPLRTAAKLWGLASFSIYSQSPLYNNLDVVEPLSGGQGFIKVEGNASNLVQAGLIAKNSVSGDPGSNGVFAGTSSYNGEALESTMDATERLIIWSGVAPPPPITYHTVTFKYQDGTTADKTVSVQSGYKVAKPDPDPTRASYTFGGWYTVENPGDGDTPYNFETAVTQNIILYAKWNTIPVESIIIIPPEDTIFVGETTGTFVAEVLPANATNKNIEWVISKQNGNDKKASIKVDPGGQYTVTVEGKVRSRINITAKALDGSGVQDKAKVTIKVRGKLMNVPKTTVDTPVKINVGDTVNYGVYGVYNDGVRVEGQPAISYKSSTKGMLSTYNSDSANHSYGDIVAKKPGTAIVTYKLLDPEWGGYLERSFRLQVSAS